VKPVSANDFVTEVRRHLSLVCQSTHPTT
jgi:hypothetical protein